MIGGLITIAGGTLASSGFIISRRPNAQQLIEKLAPYQGWIGAVMFGWGIWEVLGAITGIGLLSSHPLTWIFWLASGVADLLVGFLLAFALITKYALGKNATALEKGQQLRTSLVKYQSGLGLFAIAMGVLYVVWLYVL